MEYKNYEDYYAHVLYVAGQQMSNLYNAEPDWWSYWAGMCICYKTSKISKMRNVTLNDLEKQGLNEGLKIDCINYGKFVIGHVILNHKRPLESYDLFIESSDLQKKADDYHKKIILQFSSKL